MDNNATTRPSESVVEAVGHALTATWANPSSVHRAGQGARAVVELARREIAGLIGASPRELVFTSGGTESLDLAVRGVLAASRSRVCVSTRAEHAAVRDLLEQLEKEGAAEVRWAPIGRDGVVDTDALAGLLEGAGLCCVQWANNETGSVQPVERIHALCRERGATFICDGVQWVGKEETKRRGDGETKGGVGSTRAAGSTLPCDMLAISPHKFHGPKGIGVLWARRGVRIRPTIHGSQELGRRGGTENVPGIVGAAAACREAAAWLARPEERARLSALRDRFETAVLAGVPDAVVNGPRGEGARIWNTTNIGFPRLEAEALLLLLSERGVCASAGAACSSGSLEPSPVLLAMGVPPEVAHGSVRFSLSRETTQAEVDEAAGIVVECVAKLRKSMNSME